MSKCFIGSKWSVGLMAAASLLVAGCTTNKAGQPVELSAEAVCLAHYEGNQMEQDRCKLPPGASHGPVPDARPQDLPIKTKGPGDIP